MLDRRGFSAGLLGAFACPAIIRTPGLIMPVRPERAPAGLLQRPIIVVWDGRVWRPINPAAAMTIPSGMLEVRFVAPDQWP